jgi:hypothetical protein
MVLADAQVVRQLALVEKEAADRHGLTSEGAQATSAVAMSQCG